MLAASRLAFDPLIPWIVLWVLTGGAVVLALTVTGVQTASTLDLAPGLFLIGAGAGMSMGQLFEFILAGSGKHIDAPVETVPGPQTDVHLSIDNSII